MKRIFIALMAAIVLTSLVLVCAGAAQEKDLASKFLRFHVLANSDSDEDQALKLKVRDAVLDKVQLITENTSSFEEAKAMVFAELSAIETAAKQCLAENGSTFTVSVNLEQCDFPTKNYGLFALPAGSYEALRVKIGEAAGQNWWCVLFPPLCSTATSEEFVQAAAVAGVSEEDIALLEGKRVFKFKLAELFAYLKELIRA